MECISQMSIEERWMVDRFVRCYPYFGKWEDVIDCCKNTLGEERVLRRLIEKDTSLWGSYATQVANRLGWVDCPSTMVKYVDELAEFVEEVRRDGYKTVLLLGMGGSSLAAEMFRCVLGVKPGYLDVRVVDSTDPEVITSVASESHLKENLYVVASKSGDTVETLALLHLFYEKVAAEVGEAHAGKYFVAITDPGSNLERFAQKFAFRRVFLNDPCVGGRFSALSFFGILPAVLMGIEPSPLLLRALRAMDSERKDGQEGCAVQIGSFLGAMAHEGRDKATFILTEKTRGFGAWLEQLIAESTGKGGKGILPVLDEPPGDPFAYGLDRFFIRLRFHGEEVDDSVLKSLVNAGFPLLDIELAGSDAVGAFCQIWELGVAIAGWLLEINPFDQPDVEEAKGYAREMVEKKELFYFPADPTRVNLTEEGVDEAVGRAIKCLSSLKQGDYVSFLLYLPPDGEVEKVFRDLREAIRDKYRVASTLNYGPRYLHSTGQLHKGGPNTGVFIVFTAERRGEAPLTGLVSRGGTKVSFAGLQMAQAMGDVRALRSRGRRVLCLHLSDLHRGGLEVLRGFCAHLGARIKRGEVL